MKNMKKIQKYILILFVLIIPRMVFASTGNDDFPISSALLVEAFVTIHMSLFVILPISELVSKDNKNLFWTLFFIRIGFLLFFDLFITTYIAFVDMIFLAIGAFIITPILSIFVKKHLIHFFSKKDTTVGEKNELKCKKCNTIINSKHKFAAGCGTKLTSKNVLVTISNKKMTKKDEFIKYVEDLIDGNHYEMSENVRLYLEALKGKVEEDKPIFTDNGKLILQYLKNHQETPMWKARDIAEGLFISSRAVSGAMRKLVSDGFVEKVGQDPVMYALTDAGRNIKIDN